MAEFGAAATLLSDFTGADENPLSEGGNWGKLNSADAQDLRRVSNQITSNGATTGSKYWTPTNFGPHCEAYVTIATKPDNGNVVGVFARAQGEGGSGTWDAYQAIFSAAAGTDTWALQTITNNATVTTIASGSREFASGEKVGIRCLGSLIQIWCFTAGAWTKLGEGTDTTYPNAGKAGARVRGITARGDDFYAGTINPSLLLPNPNRPVILRQR